MASRPTALSDADVKALLTVAGFDSRAAAAEFAAAAMSTKDGSSPTLDEHGFTALMLGRGVPAAAAARYFRAFARRGNDEIDVREFVVGLAAMDPTTVSAAFAPAWRDERLAMVFRCYDLRAPFGVLDGEEMRLLVMHLLRKCLTADPTADQVDDALAECLPSDYFEQHQGVDFPTFCEAVSSGKLPGTERLLRLPQLAPPPPRCASPSSGSTSPAANKRRRPSPPHDDRSGGGASAASAAIATVPPLPPLQAAQVLERTVHFVATADGTVDGLTPQGHAAALLLRRSHPRLLSPSAVEAAFTAPDAASLQTSTLALAGGGAWIVASLACCGPRAGAAPAPDLVEEFGDRVDFAQCPPGAAAPADGANGVARATALLSLIGKSPAQRIAIVAPPALLEAVLRALRAAGPHEKLVPCEVRTLRLRWPAGSSGVAAADTEVGVCRLSPSVPARADDFSSDAGGHGGDEYEERSHTVGALLASSGLAPAELRRASSAFRRRANVGAVGAPHHQHPTFAYMDAGAFALAMAEVCHIPVNKWTPEYFRSANRSATGLVDEIEWLAWVCALDPRTAHDGAWLRERASLIFRVYNCDGSGTLDVTQLTSMTRHLLMAQSRGSVPDAAALQRATLAHYNGAFRRAADERRFVHVASDAHACNFRGVSRLLRAPTALFTAPDASSSSGAGAAGRGAEQLALAAAVPDGGSRLRPPTPPRMTFGTPAAGAGLPDPPKLSLGLGPTDASAEALAVPGGLGPEVVLDSDMVVHDMNAASPWANASTSSAGVPPGSPRLSMLASVSRFPGGSNRSVDLLDHGAVESAAFVPSFRPSASVDIAADPETTARGIDAATLQAARGCIDVAMRLVRRVAVEPKDMSDAEWVGLHGASLLDRLLGSSSRSERAHLSQLATLHRLCSAAKDVLAAQPTLVNVRAPVKIFGDIHGQLRDLLLLWAEFGSPSHRSGDLDMCSYVFNGDWVDRGRHQLEVVTLLFALKVRYPDRIWLVRGNHECADLNSTMTANGQNGFDGACADAFGETDGHRVFQWFHETFAYLPLAACVEKSILVLHGGIGNGDFDLDDVRRISRPLDHDACWSNRLVREILWSDPVRHDGSVGRGVHRSPRDGGRGDVVCFGADVTAAFCRRNGLRVVVRSHQYEELGFRIMHNGHLITVFSARDYDQSVVTGGAHTNSGAILLVTDVGNNDSEESADRRILRIKAKVLYARARSPASARGTPGGVFGARIAEEQAAAAAAADADADADADDEMGR